MERKTITNAVNSEQSLSKLNPEAAEYQPQECVFYDPLQEAVRALDDHSTDSFIPRRSARIQERLINNTPNGQNTSTADQCIKADVSVQADLKSDGDDNTPKSTQPSTNGAESSTSRQEERELDDSATEHDTAPQRSEQNDGDNEDDNEGRVQTEAATMEDSQEPLENEVQDGAITSELIKGIIDIPDITEDDYVMDEDFADIYKYIKYDTLTNENAKNKKLLLMADFYYIDNDKLFKIAPPRSRKMSR